jgi:hypothetical protein
MVTVMKTSNLTFFGDISGSDRKAIPARMLVLLLAHGICQVQSIIVSSPQHLHSYTTHHVLTTATSVGHHPVYSALLTIIFLWSTRPPRKKKKKKKKTPWPLVHKRTIQTKRPPLVNEI